MLLLATNPLNFEWINELISQKGGKYDWLDFQIEIMSLFAVKMKIPGCSQAVAFL